MSSSYLEHGQSTREYRTTANEIPRGSVEFGNGEVDAIVPPTTLRFDSDASIFLVGLPGAGKKTLGVIASLALRRRLIDFSQVFTKHTGSSPQEFFSQYGAEAYRQTEKKLVALLIKECSKNHVIIGLHEPGTWAQDLLSEVYKTCPVVYVHRAREHLLTSLPSRQENFDRWYGSFDTFYRTCSNLDFHNINCELNKGMELGTTQTLKLKETEIDFTRFLYRVFDLPFQLMYSQHPFSQSYTRVLQTPLKWLQELHNEEELECGADAIMLIVEPSDDHLELHRQVTKQVARLRRHTRCPVILDFQHTASEFQAYLNILQWSARTVPDAVTLDLRNVQSQVLSVVRLPQCTAVIGSFECLDSWQNSLNSKQLQQIGAKLGCKALRVYKRSSSASENFECINFARAANAVWDIPIIAYNTGKTGQTSVCLNPTLSPVVLPSLHRFGVTVQQANKAIYASFISTAKTYTIFGKSVSNSLSPHMHNSAYTACGMPHRYRAVQSDDFGDIQKILKEDDCGGVVVSLPYKTEVLPLLHSISSDAGEMGAVNTIIVEEGIDDKGNRIRRLKGMNTDYIGMRQCIYRHLSPANAVREGTSALILGAGGMARAGIYACRKLGVENVCIFNRTPENAQTLVRTHTSASPKLHILSKLSDSWPAELKQPTIVISTLPGDILQGEPAHDLILPEHWLLSKTGGVFMEMAYTPSVTRFIQQIRGMASRGWIAVDGLTMLVEQGIAQFEMLTGSPAPVHVMREAVRGRNGFDIRLD